MRFKPNAVVFPVAAWMLCVSHLCLADSLSLLWQTSPQLKNPESVVYDGKRKVLYVSNVNGDGTEKAGNGFISRVSMDGTIESLKWVTDGLNAPKGLAIGNDRLYVADIDQLVEIDSASGQVTKRHPVEDAVFLNDVTVDSAGNVYVSDMMTDTIHRLKDGQIERWLHNKALLSPNGLLAEKDRLVVGAWGVRKEGFATTTAGHLMAVSLNDKSITPIGAGAPVGNLDGVESDGRGNYYVTDWMAGAVLRIDAQGTVTRLLDLNPGSADHAYLADQHLLLIPMMQDNTLSAYRVADADSVTAPKP